MIKVLVVEGLGLVAESVSASLKENPDIEVVGMAALDKALLQARNLKPDIVLLEIAARDIIGFHVIPKIKLLNNAPRVIVVTCLPQTIYLIQALKAGVCGYITKYSSPEVLVTAIHTCMQGENYVAQELAEQLAWDVVSNLKSPFEKLSIREFQAMLMLVHGKTIRDIADVFCVSEKTVTSYHSRLLQKLNLSSDAALVQFVYEQNLLEFIV